MGNSGEDRGANIERVVKGWESDDVTERVVRERERERLQCSLEESGERDYSVA